MSNSSHLKSSVKHAFIYSFSNLFQKAVGFVMLPVYAHYLRGEGYGIVGMIDILLSVLTVVVGYGISGALQLFYFERDSLESKNKLVSTALILTALVSISVCIVPLILNNWVSLLLFGDNTKGFYVLIALFTFLAEMTSYSATAYIMLLKRSKFYVILSIARLFIGFTLNIIFIIKLDMGVIGYLYSTLITSFIYCVYVHIDTFKKVGISFVKKDAIDIIRWSFPLIPGSLSMFVRNNVDRIILRTFLGLTSLGAYNMIFKFADLLSILILTPFLQIWGVKRLEVAETVEGPELMAKAFTMQLSVMLFAGLVLSVEIPLVLQVLTPEEFWVPSTFAFLAVLSKVFFGSYYHFMFGLAYKKVTFKISIIQISTSLVATISGFFLISYYGFLGALITACLIYLFQCSFTYAWAQKYYYIPYEWAKIKKISLSFIVLFLMIDSLTMSQFSIIQNINNYFYEITKDLSGIDHNGLKKILIFLSSNFTIFIDISTKFLLSFLFLFALIFSKIITKNEIVSLSFSSYNYLRGKLTSNFKS